MNEGKSTTGRAHIPHCHGAPKLQYLVVPTESYVHALMEAFLKRADEYTLYGINIYLCKS